MSAYYGDCPKCKAQDIIDIDTQRCGSCGYALGDMEIEAARAEGFRAGLEAAAVRLDELAKEHRAESVKYMNKGNDDASDAMHDAAVGYESGASAIRALEVKP